MNYDQHTYNRGQTTGMDIQITTDLASEPVTLNEAKEYLKVDYADDNDLITTLIKSARKTIERYTGRSLGAKTIKVYYATVAEVFTLPYGPVNAVTEVKKVADNGDETVLTVNEGYYLRGVSDKQMSIPNYAGNSFYITYTTQAGCPEDLKIALLKQVSTDYDNRDNYIPGSFALDKDVKRMIATYRVNAWGI